jgi:lantibiotic modifying enzyme
VTVDTDSAYAAAARHLADRLVSLAVAGRDGEVTWSGDDVDPVRSTAQRVVLTHGRLDDSLHTGRAGVAVALAVCARLPDGRNSWAELARRVSRSTVHHALAARPQPGGLGWSAGWLGIARAARLVAGWTADDALAAASVALAGRAVRALAEDPDLCPDYPDLLDGWAGHLTAVLAADLPADLEPVRRRAAAALLDRLLPYAEGSAVPGGPVSWPMAGTEHAVIGLAHGGSGISVALAAARAAGRAAGLPDGLAAGLPAPIGLGAQVAPDQRLEGEDPAAVDDVMARTLLWEDGHFRAEAGGWPDLRRGADAPGLAWCHGAPGVGIAAAYRALAGAPDGTQLTFTRAAAMVQAYGVPGGDHQFDGTLCHGLTGSVELYLAGAEAWPEAAGEHLTSARLLARHLTRAGRDGPGWVCGVRDGRTPNLLTGLAGVAYTLARCHDPALAPSLAHPGLPAVADRGSTTPARAAAVDRHPAQGADLGRHRAQGADVDGHLAQAADRGRR